MVRLPSVKVCTDPALVTSACLRVRARRGTLYVWRDGRRLRMQVGRDHGWPTHDAAVAAGCRACWRAGVCLDESALGWCRRG